MSWDTDWTLISHPQYLMTVHCQTTVESFKFGNEPDLEHEWTALRAQSDRRGALLEELIYAHEEKMPLDVLVGEARREMFGEEK